MNSSGIKTFFPTSDVSPPRGSNYIGWMSRSLGSMGGVGIGRTSRRLEAELIIVSGLDLRVANANAGLGKFSQESLIPILVYSNN